MKYLLSVFVLSATVFATDASVIRQSMVKITSKIEANSSEFRGSGLLFKKNGKRYVLTSDHVVAHANDHFTGLHSAIGSVSGERLTLTFLASEWGNGLALLEVKDDPNPGNAVPYSDLLAKPSTQVGEQASFYGYPYESNSLTEETFATILNFEAPLPYFVMARKLLELEAAVGEFGMSGGSVFSNQGDFLGVLAYQRILDLNRENRVYAIPRELVLNWLDNYFKVAPKYLPYFSEPWFGQGNPQQFLFTNDGLLLMFRIYEDGAIRQLIGRVENLIILSDGPSLPYDDGKGFMKIFRKYMAENPMRPSEYGVIDRSSGKPTVVKIRYPAEIFQSFDKPDISLFIVMSEKHEERYERVFPLAQSLIKQLTQLQAEMKAINTATWSQLSQDLQSVSKKLQAMPAKPTNPTVEGASEYYNVTWATDFFFQLEANAAMAGWKEAEKQSAVSTKASRDAIAKLKDAMKFYEYKP